MTTVLIISTPAQLARCEWIVRNMAEKLFVNGATLPLQLIRGESVWGRPSLTLRAHAQGKGPRDKWGKLK